MSGTEQFSDAAYIHNFIGRPGPSPEVGRADFADKDLSPIESPLSIPAPDRTWSSDEWTTIKRGHRAADMDDKWEGFVDDECLYLHRSWTGRGIYEAQFAPKGSVWKIVEAAVTNDSKYSPLSGECESLFLEVILETVFLGLWPEAKLEASVRCFREASARG